MNVKKFFKILQCRSEQFDKIIELELSDEPEVIDDSPTYLMERIGEYIWSEYINNDDTLLSLFCEILEKNEISEEIENMIGVSFGETAALDIQHWDIKKIHKFENQYSAEISKIINIDLIKKNTTRRKIRK